MSTWRDFLRSEKATRAQKRSNRPFKQYHFLTPEFLRRQSQEFKLLLNRSTETAEERRLWRHYEKLVHESFRRDNPKQKFSLSHVEALGIEWDILFLYSKKDVGKTWAAAHYITTLLEAHPEAQVAFIRNSKEEAKGFISMMNNSDVWPTWTNGELVFKKKDIKKGKKTVRNLKPCGIFAYCSGTGFTRWQGGDWSNIRFWYWDECNSVQGGLTDEVFQALNVFLSSLIRDKSGEAKVKGLMTGNLLEKSNIFLSRLGVGARTRLKVFEVHKDGDRRKELMSRLLYLNTGDMFKGIEGQKGLATHFLDEDERNALLSNRPGLLSGKAQYEELDLKNFKTGTAFVFRHTETSTVNNTTKEVDYVLYTYRVPNSARTVVWIDKFKTTTIKPGFKRLYCQESILSNTYPMLIPVEEPEEFGESFIQPIEERLYAGEIWFGWNNTQDVFENAWPFLRSKYLSQEDTSI